MCILIFNQAVYFGEILDRSLINTNQIKLFGIPVPDNPYDSVRDFGINHDNLFIFFSSGGSTLFFNYFLPKDADINTCPHMFLIDIVTKWYPHGVEMATNGPYGDNAI